MDGHWFSGAVCPMDGSESEWSRAVNDAGERVEGGRLSLELLVQHGLPTDATHHVLVIDHDLASWPPVQPIEIVELAEHER